MAVHRISDYAEECLQRIAASEGKKPGAVLDELIRAYARGLTFETGEDGRPDLSDLPAPCAHCN